MTTQETSFTLKDGRTAVIRNPRESDIADMLDYLYNTSGETEFLLRYPEECVKYTPEGEKALFERVNASDNEEMFVCTVDGKIVGNSMINWPKGIKTRHRANVAIAVYREYWGQGIGTELFERMIAVAEKNPDILQMELTYIEGNARARALYEKMGFRVAYILPNAIRLKSGKLLNEYGMIRPVEHTVR